MQIHTTQPAWDRPTTPPTWIQLQDHGAHLRWGKLLRKPLPDLLKIPSMLFKLLSCGWLFNIHSTMKPLVRASKKTRGDKPSRSPYGVTTTDRMVGYTERGGAEVVPANFTLAFLPFINF